MVQGESSRSRKPTIERGHYMDNIHGCPLRAILCVHPEFPPESNSVQSLDTFE